MKTHQKGCVLFFCKTFCIGSIRVWSKFVTSYVLLIKEMLNRLYMYIAKMSPLLLAQQFGVLSDGIKLSYAWAVGSNWP
jgi:hypothetical protein